MKIVICFVILRIVGVISDDEFSNFRLNNYLYPVHYDLQLDLFISDGYFKGTVDIEMKSEQEIPPSTSHIELNSKGIDLDSYSVKLMKEGKPLKLGVILEQDQLEKVTFLLNEDLETDTSYKLHIVFKRDFAVDGDVGLLLRSYTNGDNGTSNYYVAANLYPTYARTVFPCFDEPHFKATFNVTLTHTPEMKSISTMPLLQTNFGLNTKGEKIVWNIFEQTPPISPSSIGLFISNMASQTRNGIIIWAANRERAEQISNLPHFEFFHAAMQEMTSIHLQIPLNFVFAPDLHVNAFESFGIAYIRSNDLEQKLNVEWFIGSILADIISNSQSFLVEIAKQVAVQYFDHMVTPKLWSDIWLMESLSEYYGLLMACKLDNDSSYENLIPPMLRNQVFDGSFENQQILLTGNFNTSKQLYRSLSSRSIISKGVSLLFMISDIFGDSIISQGVSSYLKKFFLGSATTQDLMNEWGNQLEINNILLPYNITLQKFLQPWLESEEEPILHVERIQDSNYSTLIISQIQSNNSMHNLGWYVPVHYISGRDMNPIENWSGPHIENGKMTNEITIENASGVDDWIILNPQGIGLYRVAYDPVSWELLMNQLKRNLTEIPTAARSLLISDAFSLARDGIVHYSNALEMAEYLVNETSFLPWLSAFREFEELESRLYYNGELFGSFRMYVINFVQVLYQNIGFPSYNVDGSSYEEDYLNILLRSKTIEWSCNYDIEDCIEKSLTTVKHYLSGNITKMKDEYIDAILCGGLSQADSKTWNEAFNFMNSSTKMRKLLISALGCSKHPHLIQSYLDKTLSADIIMNKKDVLEVFEGIYSKHYNYEKALDFLGTNIGNIQLKYGNDTFNKILIGVSKYATTLDHFEKINQISSKIERNEDLMMELNRTLKHVQELGNWMIVNGKHLREYFSDGNTEGEFSKSRNNGENILLLGVVMLYSTATNLF